MSDVSPKTIKRLFETFETMNIAMEEMYKLTMTHNHVIRELQNRVKVLEGKLANEKNNPR